MHDQEVSNIQRNTVDFILIFLATSPASSTSACEWYVEYKVQSFRPFKQLRYSLPYWIKSCF